MIDNNECTKVSDYIYEKLSIKPIEILYDDRECSIGKKLSDNELIGIPFNIIIGKRDLENNLIEIKNRLTNENHKMSPDEAINFLSKVLSV